MDLHELLVEFERRGQAERPEGITASGVDPICRRQQAFELQGVPPSDDQDPVSAATVGSLIHEAYAALWQQRDPAAQVEVRGEHGKPDVVRQTEDGRRQVRDLKTKNHKGFMWWVENGVDTATWDQLRIYGLDAGLADGDELVVDVLCREKGLTATYVEWFDRAEAQEALDRLHALEDEALAADPIFLPADRSGRGDYFCDRCPWVSTCCGPDETPKPPLLSDPQVEDAAAQYREAMVLEREAKAVKDKAKAVLKHAEPGTYGEWQVEVRHVESSWVEAYERAGYDRLTVKGAK